MRDSLRLEAGLCLYGNDLNDDITPKQANLVWTMTPRRQVFAHSYTVSPSLMSKAEGGFIGSDVILAELPGKIGDLPRRRIGLKTTGPPARAGAPILADGEVIGHVTSGGFAPSLKEPIAMGYVKPPHHKKGTKVSVSVHFLLYFSSFPL